MDKIKQNLSYDDLDNILRQLIHKYPNGMESYEFGGITNNSEHLSYLLNKSFITQRSSFYYITVKGQTFAKNHSFNNINIPIVQC